MKRFLWISFSIVAMLLVSVWFWTGYVINQRASARYAINPINLHSRRRRR